VRAIVATAVAGLLVACGDGPIHLSSGLGPADATTTGADAESFEDAATPSASADAPAHGCLLDTDCPLASLHCDTASGTCVQCTKDSDCTKPGYPRCDLATRMCVACAVNADCADGGVCDLATLHCAIPCKDGGTCAGDDQTCNSHGYCASCMSTQDASACGSASMVCDDGVGQCAECTGDSQCPISKPHCHLGSDTCVQCLTSSQCSAATPVCDPATWTCVL
jgi:Cys-rich repeat protein